MGGGGEAGRPVTSLGSGDKARPPHSRPGHFLGSGVAVPLGDTCRRSLRSSPWEPRPPRQEHHAPERGSSGPCTLGLQTLGGHRLQPAFGHHQGRCFRFCAAGRGLACGGVPRSGEWPTSPGTLGGSSTSGSRQPLGKELGGCRATYELFTESAAICILSVPNNFGREVN